MSESLLPYNATKLEKALEEATRCTVDVDILRGFKFSTSGDNLNLALSWEYSLSQINIDDFKERVIQGLKFHQLCGTPYALRMAFSWYGFNDIKIEEEEPGEHFAEFQIGLKEIPNDFDVRTIVEVAELASSLRSRLRRMYNDLYDIRCFILDESDWGDFLSDYSGYQPYEGAPKFSFGRINNYDCGCSFNFATIHSLVRWHYAYAMNMDTYRLDWAILDESDVGTPNHDMSREAHRYLMNKDFAGSAMGNIFESRKVAKALILLSEDCVLEDLNSCFSCGIEEIKEEVFKLSYSYLSESKNESTFTPIACRYINEGSHYALSKMETKIGRGRHISYRCFVCEPTSKVYRMPETERVVYGSMVATALGMIRSISM